MEWGADEKRLLAAVDCVGPRSCCREHVREENVRQDEAVAVDESCRTDDASSFGAAAIRGMPAIVQSAPTDGRVAERHSQAPSQLEKRDRKRVVSSSSALSENDRDGTTVKERKNGRYFATGKEGLGWHWLVR